jgi:diguanylate cyclase (GGDEF)-like protein
MTALRRIGDSGFLRGLRLFDGVDPDVILPYLERTGRRDLAAGEVLLTPDRENTEVFVVLSGRLKVHLDSLDRPPLTVLESGSCAGEMSIIEDREPSAYVVAAEPAHLMVIGQRTLWDLVDVSHAFARNLLVVLSERVRQDNEVIVDSVGILREFERNAVRDALTDLYNRHWLEDMFRRRISRLQKSHAVGSLMMLDVDQFKRFNDKFGHLAGDHALCHVADALRTHFRPDDLIARYGGDEFAVLLPDIAMQEAVGIGERVRTAIATSSTSPDSSDPPITISVGIAEMTPQDTLETLLNNADAALYRAKLKGRNCVSD